MGNIETLLSTLGERIGGHADVRKVYGEPLTAGGRTIVPVARVRFGYGAGGGKGRDQQDGGGGGGGAHASPAGVLEVTPEGTRFIPFFDWPTVAIAGAVGFVSGLIVARALGRRG